MDAPVKWVDNLLSHHDVPGCSGGRQGVARRISDLGVLAIAHVRLFASELGMPVSRAVALVRNASDGVTVGPLRTTSGLRIEPSPQMAADLQERLRDALQAAPRRRRGRPRRLEA